MTVVCMDEASGLGSCMFVLMKEGAYTDPLSATASASNNSTLPGQ